MVWIARSSSVMSSSRDNSRAPGRLRAVSSGCGLGAGYANLAAQNFPGGALGQLVDEPHLAGVFVGSDPVFDEGADLRGGGADARFEHDGGADLFAEQFVGDADDGGLGDGGMLVEHLLDLARIHVVAAADDELLLSIDDVVAAVFVDSTDVTGGEPAVDDARLGGLGQLPVALHHVVPTDLDFTVAAVGHFVSRFVDHSHLDTFNGGSDRARFANPVGEVETHH